MEDVIIPFCKISLVNEFQTGKLEMFNQESCQPKRYLFLGIYEQLPYYFLNWVKLLHIFASLA